MRYFTIGLFLFISTCGYAQYRQQEHRRLFPGEEPVSKAGSYFKAGTTYVLVDDISSATSAIFLGKDVTLDLNGYTIRYADGGYGHIPNSGFEEGLKGWDLSKAPGAKLENTEDVHVFLGKKLLSLRAGDEITSSYIDLPVAGRSYFAMCGVTGRYYHDMKKYPEDEMKVSVYVEDERGNPVRCVTEYGDTTMVSCPVEKRSPRLGGGFVYAHLDHLPAGRYRVRVRADNDCLVDEIDLRPAMDVGVGVISKTIPLAHYDHVIRESYPPIIPAFYDYTGDMAACTPLPGLPQVTGAGTITIKNGTIESGAAGILSWGIQSTAADVKVILENVKIKTSGISCGAADISWAKISHCVLDVDMPFLVQRHANVCSVILRGYGASEVSNCSFYGGEGCLSIKGKYSLVHDNLFKNRETETNHYCIMGTGDSSKIYRNRFEPEEGSGIYVTRYTEVYDNIFKISTSPPTCEYGREEYSTAAVRLGDYHAAPGSPKASIGNRIHDNTIYLTARGYPGPASYLPMCWGVFYSASGGENEVYRNNFVVDKTDTSSRVRTAALYICGGPRYFGGRFYDNRITTNVPAGWIASIYGGASNSQLVRNTIVPLGHASFKTFTIGYPGCDDCVAKNVEFRSNRVIGGSFDLDVSDQDHSYAVYWTLGITVTDGPDRPVGQAEVEVLDRNGAVVRTVKTDGKGKAVMELPEYRVEGKEREMYSPYVIVTGKIKKEVDLDRDKEITIDLAPSAEAVTRRVADHILEETSFRFTDTRTGRTFASTRDIPYSDAVRVDGAYNEWYYMNGVNNLALMRLAAVTGDRKYSDYSIRNFDFIFANLDYFRRQYNDKVANSSFGQFFRMGKLDDCGAMSAALAEANHLDGKKEWQDYLSRSAAYITGRQQRLADGTLARPEPRKMTVWADDLYMSVPFLAGMGKFTGDKRYFDEAIRQVDDFTRHLYDPATGLFYHCWYSDVGMNGVAHWGRCNGWVMLAQVELLNDLPAGHPARERLIGMLLRQIQGVSRYQDASGLWHQLLDKPDSYLETSCSAMFVYGIARAVNEGWIPGSYLTVARNGWAGVLSRIRPDGEVADICVGTGIEDDIAFYYNRPKELNDLHGLGATILAGIEMMRADMRIKLKQDSNQ